jgi:hypothetical protein
LLSFALAALFLAPIALLIFDFARGARRRDRMLVPPVDPPPEDDGWASASDLARK